MANIPEMIFAGIKHERIGSFETMQEAQDDAKYWRKRGYRARVIIGSFDKQPYDLYVSTTGRRRRF